MTGGGLPALARIRLGSARALLLALLVLPLAAVADQPDGAPGPAATSRHEGYYYPKVTRREVYRARTRPLRGADRAARLLFVSSSASDQQSVGYAPRYAMFAKGEQAEKLIIIGFDDQFLATVYRSRALMAALSALARLTPLLKDADLGETLTFYDLTRLMGFTQITISDGRKFTYQIKLE